MIFSSLLSLRKGPCFPYARNDVNVIYQNDYTPLALLIQFLIANWVWKYCSYKTFIHFAMSEKRILWNNQAVARIRAA
jgi:hypothetical protein